jgi:hypothetical protein
MSYKDIKLMIATPMFGGQCYAHYTYATNRFTKLAADIGLDIQYQFLFTESLITRGRNSLASTFLNSECTHLMFIDADIGFEPDDILKLLSHNKPLICGGYPIKIIDWDSISDAIRSGINPRQLHTFASPYVYNRVPTTKNINGLIEVKESGTGFMLVKREVFELLSDKVPEYTSNQFGENVGAKIKEYFATSIEDGLLLSEDYHFCRLYRRYDGTVYLDTTIKLQHVGTYVYESSKNHHIR